MHKAKAPAAVVNVIHYTCALLAAACQTVSCQKGPLLSGATIRTRELVDLKGENCTKKWKLFPVTKSFYFHLHPQKYESWQATNCDFCLMVFIRLLLNVCAALLDQVFFLSPDPSDGLDQASSLSDDPDLSAGLRPALCALYSVNFGMIYSRVAL